MTFPNGGFTGARLRTSVTRPPCRAVRFDDAKLSEKSGWGFASKFAVTDSFPFSVTTQVAAPEHAPLHPVNAESPAGVAVRVTIVPVGKLLEQTWPQSIPLGLLVTVPLPLPV